MPIKRNCCHSSNYGNACPYCGNVNRRCGPSCRRSLTRLAIGPRSCALPRLSRRSSAVCAALLIRSTSLSASESCASSSKTSSLAMTLSSSATASPPACRPRRMAARQLPAAPMTLQAVEVTFCVRGVVSPLLANLFLHYVFDLWMARTHPDLPWCRYADDGLVHCRSEQEAIALKAELYARLAACGLELHPTKTKIVYCKDGKRQGTYPNVKFDFLGYCFRPRLVRRFRDNTLFCCFNS